ncbi:MAG: hypothetical protein AzoDbin1_04124 [Azoarcus sp.]|nr:hypothetical protein [Azoarcus sp.]
MPVLTAFRVPAGQWTRDHLNTATLDTLGDHLYDDRKVSAIKVGVVGALTRNDPVESGGGRVLGGVKARGYADDWYNRVHVIPRQLDLGNVVSTQVSTVTVWNAWLESRTLNAITGADNGIVVSGQLAPPLLFTPLLQRTYDIAVTPDGSPVLDATVLWQFDNAEKPGLRVTANRVIAWSFVPDWSDGITERLTWATDILQSESLVEQRRALRAAPHREFEAQMMVEGRERQYLDLVLFDWGVRIWALPVWPEIQWLSADLAADALSIPCATAGLEFHIGGLAMLIGANAFAVEVVEVVDVPSGALMLKRPTQKAWPAGSRLYPARSAQLTAEPALTRRTDRLISADVTFRVIDPCDVTPVAPATLYRTRPVLEARPDEGQDLTASYVRLLEELDNGSSTPRVTDIAGRAMPVLSQRWIGAGRTERADYRALLYHLAGRQGAVWVPTHADDLTLIEPVGATSVALTVAHVGYTRFGKATPGRRDIRIELTDGTFIHRRVTGSTEISTDAEALAIDTALGRAVAPADVLRISWMQLCRLDHDAVEIHHMTDSEGVAESALVFRGVRDDDL